MDFDSVSVQKAGGSVLMSADEFMALPTEERINLIVAGKVDFIKDGKIIPHDEILGSAEQPEATGAHLAVLNDAGAPTKRIHLSSDMTSLGKTGKKTGVIARTPKGYLLKCIEGTSGLLLNGRVVPSDGILLKDRDILSVIGTRLQFFA